MTVMLVVTRQGSGAGGGDGDHDSGAGGDGDAGGVGDGGSSVGHLGAVEVVVMSVWW